MLEESMEALLAVAEEHVEDNPLIDEDFKTIKEDDDRTKIKSSQYRGTLQTTLGLIRTAPASPGSLE